MRTQILFLVVVLCLVLAGGWWWNRTSVPAGSTEPIEVPVTATSSEDASSVATTTEDIYALYEPLYPMQIGTQSVQGSVAVTAEERRQGLSHTPELPADVVKVFVFPDAGQWSFWMKDMNYPIDIIWVDASGVVVHVEAEVTPESYPNSFVSPEPAKYVIETVAGFAGEHAVTNGTSVTLPEQF